MALSPLVSARYDKDDGQPGIVIPNFPIVGTGSVTMTAQTLYVVRFTVSRPMSITLLAYNVQTAASTDQPVDGGIYDSTMANLLGSAGATTGKLSSGGAKTLTLTAATTVVPGTVYYAGLWGDTPPTAGSAAIVTGANFASATAVALFGSTAPKLTVGTKTAQATLPGSVASPTTVSAVPMLALRES